jgi:hypothetical protein
MEIKGVHVRSTKLLNKLIFSARTRARRARASLYWSDKASKPLDPSRWDSLIDGIKRILPDAEPVKARVDNGYIAYPKWADGAATQELLAHVNASPEIRAALNKSSSIPHKALNNLKRDEAFAKQYGVTNEAIQNARRIIGAGPGWIDRLEAGLKEGAILPAVAAGILFPVLRPQEQDPQEKGL